MDVSEKPCLQCRELLHWSESEHPPDVLLSTRTGKIWSVSLMRSCIHCGYREIGDLEINVDPTWTKQE